MPNQIHRRFSRFVHLQETRDMLDNFAIAVKGGIHYTEKDFAVLGTETATHPKNSEALANLQIFFRHTCTMLVCVWLRDQRKPEPQSPTLLHRQLNTQRRFEELGQDLLGTMLHLKGYFKGFRVRSFFNFVYNFRSSFSVYSSGFTNRQFSTISTRRGAPKRYSKGWDGDK